MQLLICIYYTVIQMFEIHFLTFEKIFTIFIINIKKQCVRTWWGGIASDDREPQLNF